MSKNRGLDDIERQEAKVESGADAWIDNEVMGCEFQDVRFAAAKRFPMLILHDTTEFSYRHEDTASIGILKVSEFSAPLLPECRVPSAMFPPAVSPLLPRSSPPPSFRAAEGSVPEQERTALPHAGILPL
jgi:hypothetical protein